MEIPVGVIANTTPKRSPRQLIVITLLAIFISALLILIIYFLHSKFGFGGNNANVGSTFFDSQTAELEGKITKIQGEKVLVENLKGETAEFLLTDDFFSNKVPAGTSIGNQDTNKGIELNTMGKITLKI